MGQWLRWLGGFQTPKELKSPRAIRVGPELDQAHTTGIAGSEKQARPRALQVQLDGLGQLSLPFLDQTLQIDIPGRDELTEIHGQTRGGVRQGGCDKTVDIKFLLLLEKGQEERVSLDVPSGRGPRSLEENAGGV